jgi:DNA replication protein DnaC
MPGETASHLFQVISHRYDHGSILLTKNRGAADWGQNFEDTSVATAGRSACSTTSASSPSITGDSYRMRRRRSAAPRPHGPCAGGTLS